MLFKIRSKEDHEVSFIVKTEVYFHLYEIKKILFKNVKIKFDDGNVLFLKCPFLFQTKENLLIINVSPIDYGHVLFVPDVNSCMSQVHY